MFPNIILIIYIGEVLSLSRMSLLSQDGSWQKYSPEFFFFWGQVREHAAAVLAGLMKGGDEDLVEDFRRRAYEQANAVLKKRKNR